jgi:hypothetical protein
VPVHGVAQSLNGVSSHRSPPQHFGISQRGNDDPHGIVPIVCVQLAGLRWPIFLDVLNVLLFFLAIFSNPQGTER